MISSKPFPQSFLYLVFFFMITISVSPVVAETLDVGPFFPLNSGDQWTYQNVIDEYDEYDADQMMEILEGTDLVNGAVTKQKESSEEGFSYAVESYTNDENGICLHKIQFKESDGEGGFLTMVGIIEPPLCTSPQLADIDSGYYVNAGQVSMTIVEIPEMPAQILDYNSTTLFHGREVVSLGRLGSYDTVRLSLSLMLNGSIDGEPFVVNESEETWLAQGVGPIQYEDDWGTYQLVSSSLLPCGPELLGACVDEPGCSGAGGYWYDAECNEYPPSDFGGDGKADILLRHVTRGQLWLYQMDGNVIASSNNIGGLSTDWEIAAVADFGGDGKADILLRHSVRGQLWLYQMNGNDVAVSSNIGGLDPGWDVASVADLGGDGRADILLRHSVRGQLWLYQMNGNLVDDSSNIGGLNPEWQVASLADFGGDSKADILLRHSIRGQLWLYQMNGNTVAVSSNIGGLNPEWNVAN